MAETSFDAVAGSLNSKITKKTIAVHTDGSGYIVRDSDNSKIPVDNKIYPYVYGNSNSVGYNVATYKTQSYGIVFTLLNYYYSTEIKNTNGLTLVYYEYDN